MLYLLGLSIMVIIWIAIRVLHRTTRKVDEIVNVMFLKKDEQLRSIIDEAIKDDDYKSLIDKMKYHEEKLKNVYRELLLFKIGK